MQAFTVTTKLQGHIQATALSKVAFEDFTYIDIYGKYFARHLLGLITVQKKLEIYIYTMSYYMI